MSRPRPPKQEEASPHDRLALFLAQHAREGVDVNAEVNHVRMELAKFEQPVVDTVEIVAKAKELSSAAASFVRALDVSCGYEIDNYTAEKSIWPYLYIAEKLGSSALAAGNRASPPFYRSAWRKPVSAAGRYRGETRQQSAGLAEIRHAGGY